MPRETQPHLCDAIFGTLESPAKKGIFNMQLQFFCLFLVYFLNDIFLNNIISHCSLSVNAFDKIDTLKHRRQTEQVDVVLYDTVIRTSPRCMGG